MRKGTGGHSRESVLLYPARRRKSFRDRSTTEESKKASLEGREKSRLKKIDTEGLHCLQCKAFGTNGRAIWAAAK